jgi:hypothetical protein
MFVRRMLRGTVQRRRNLSEAGFDGAWPTTRIGSPVGRMKSFRISQLPIRKRQQSGGSFRSAELDPTDFLFMRLQSEIPTKVFRHVAHYA